MTGTILVGLTGGIGSGKSTVSAMLAEMGARIIDADAISRNLTDAGGDAIEVIRAHFGTTFITPDGAMDRHRMRELAFSDPAAKQQLEAIVHPLVGQAALRYIVPGDIAYPLAKVTLAQAAPILPYLLLVVILIVRPKGLLGTREG